MPYHVRRDDRAITDDATMLALLREGRFATFALCDGDEPYVVTLSYGMEENPLRLYFHVANEGMKLDVIASNPRACGTVVLADDYLDGRCKHPYRSVVLRGTMCVVDDPAEKSHALRVLVDHLESDPESYWERRDPQSPQKLASFTALRFDVEHMTAKAGS